MSNLARAFDIDLETGRICNAVIWDLSNADMSLPTWFAGRYYILGADGFNIGDYWDSSTGEFYLNPNPPVPEG